MSKSTPRTRAFSARHLRKSGPALTAEGVRYEWIDEPADLRPPLRHLLESLPVSHTKGLKLLQRACYVEPVVLELEHTSGRRFHLTATRDTSRVRRLS